MDRSDDTREFDTPPPAEMDEQSLDLLQRLADLGCIDPALEADILDRVTTRVTGVASIEEVRRITAEVLFERQFDPDRVGLGLLEDEWRAIFG